MRLFSNLGDSMTILKSFSQFSKASIHIRRAREAGDYNKERELIAKATYQWAEGLAKKFGAKINVYGRENIPMDRSCVFISNHQGYADIVAIFYALKDKQTGFIAKDDVKNVPFLGRWIRETRGFFLDRSNSRAALKMMQQAGEYLKDGFSLVIFPEGTRSKSNEMGEFKGGSFKLATKYKVPIVPITIDGSYAIYEKNNRIMGNEITITIHKPIETDSLSRAEASALSAEVENIIKSQLGNNNQAIIKEDN